MADRPDYKTPTLEKLGGSCKTKRTSHTSTEMKMLEFISRSEAFGRSLLEFFSKPGLELSMDMDLSDLVVNPCGDCVVCCTYPQILGPQFNTGKLPPTADKIMGKQCRYCDGKSCTVYEARPDVCKGYQCLWRFNLTDRPPNETGVAWTYEPDPQTGKAWILVGHCADVKLLWKEDWFYTELLQLLSVEVFGLGVAYAVILSSNQSLGLLFEPDKSRFIGQCVEMERMSNGDYKPLMHTAEKLIMEVSAE